MIWFPFSSFFRKKKSADASGDGGYHSRADDRVRAGRTGKNNPSDDPADDPLIQDKKRARRRLVGTVALTLGLAVTLPMVFDSTPRPPSEDIVIRVPSKDKPVPESSNPAAASLPASATTSAETPSAPLVVPAPGAAIAASTPKAAAVPATNAVASVPVAGVKAKSGNETKAADTRTVAPKLTETVQKAAAKPAPEQPKTVPPANKDLAKGKFVIQVAALATKQKIDELQAKLKSAGIKSHTQKVATTGGDRIRVRVGPFATKAEADQTCAKLGKMRLNCTILPN